MAGGCGAFPANLSPSGGRSRRTVAARSPRRGRGRPCGRSDASRNAGAARSGRARTRPARADAMAGGCGAFPAKRGGRGANGCACWRAVACPFRLWRVYRGEIGTQAGTRARQTVRTCHRSEPNRKPSGRSDAARLPRAQTANGCACHLSGTGGAANDRRRTLAADRPARSRQTVRQIGNGCACHLSGGEIAADCPRTCHRSAPVRQTVRTCPAASFGA